MNLVASGRDLGHSGVAIAYTSPHQYVIRSYTNGLIHYKAASDSEAFELPKQVGATQWQG